MFHEFPRYCPAGTLVSTICAFPDFALGSNMFSTLLAVSTILDFFCEQGHLHTLCTRFFSFEREGGSRGTFKYVRYRMVS